MEHKLPLAQGERYTGTLANTLFSGFGNLSMMQGGSAK